MTDTTWGQRPMSITNGWRRTIKLKDLLGPEGDGAAVRSCAKAMSERLKRQPDYEEDSIDLFSQIVDEIADIAESTPEDYTDENWTILAHFNSCMAGLYDWADSERVWIG